MPTENLLEEFPPVSTEAWEAAIARDLKGADYEKKLVWRTPEGMAVRPYYRAADTSGMDWTQAAPGAFPYARGAQADAGWRIRETIQENDAEKTNHAACAAVAAGAEEIAFGKIALRSQAAIALLLANLSEIPVRFESADEKLVGSLKAYLKESPRTASISTALNPLDHLEFAAEMLASLPQRFVPFTIDGAKFEAAGATAVEEIGFTLAEGVEFLAEIEKRGIDINRAAAVLEFDFAMGGSYFFDIAKLRAFRMLWARVVESFGGSKQAAQARIAARTSRWDKTIYDPHVNILRTTTQAMAAVLGGADAVSILPFDDCYREPDEASRRLARNTQLLLKREAFFARVADPGGGSYCLESITGFLADAAWKRMQETEKRGGFSKAGEWIADSLKQSMAAREKAVASRRRVFVGTNQYANPQEKALPRIDATRIGSGHRGPRAYETLRLRSERHAAAGGKIPRLLLAEIGDAKMRAARSGFASNFFACAGFEIAVRRFKTVDEIAATEADLIVLCSSDPEYAALAAELISKLKALGRATPLIVAGNPENAEELRAAGVQDFVHIRSNPIEVLTEWQDRLGISRG